MQRNYPRNIINLLHITIRLALLLIKSSALQRFVAIEQPHQRQQQQTQAADEGAVGGMDVGPYDVPPPPPPQPSHSLTVCAGPPPAYQLLVPEGSWTIKYSNIWSKNISITFFCRM